MWMKAKGTPWSWSMATRHGPFYYRNLIKGLSPTHRAIAVDHIGCGFSDKPSPSEYDYRFQSRVDDLTAFLNQMDLDRKITMIVHDWGGAIGMGYATKFPEKIGRLVILNTAAFFPPVGKGIPWRLRVVRNIRPFAGPAVLNFNAFAKGALLMASRKKLSPDVKAGLIAPYNSPANRIATLRFVQDIPLAPGDPSLCIGETGNRRTRAAQGHPHDHFVGPS